RRLEAELGIAIGTGAGAPLVAVGEPGEAGKAGIDQRDGIGGRRWHVIGRHARKSSARPRDALVEAIAAHLVARAVGTARCGDLRGGKRSDLALALLGGG